MVEVALTTSSPTLSLSTAADDTTEPFRLVLTVSLDESSRPELPITICTWRTALEPRKDLDPNERFSLDTMALGTFSLLECATDPGKTISPGRWLPKYVHGGPSQNLRDWPWLTWLTIPAKGKGVVQVTHELPLRRMFKYESKLTPDNLKPGEMYRLHIEPGQLGAWWWFWGDLDGDLKGKKFGERPAASDDSPKGADAEKSEDKEGWILSEDPNQLWFQDTGETAFMFVE